MKAKDVKIGFVPHLEVCGTDYGTIGLPTKIKDAGENPLAIGDTVELLNSSGETLGEYSIVQSIRSKFPFVMSIAIDCSPDGSIGSKWKIVKKRSYTEVKDGEYIVNVKYVKKEDA